MLESLGGGISPSYFESGLSGLSSNNSSLTSGSPPNSGNSWLFNSQSLYSSVSSPLSSTIGDSSSIFSDQVSAFCTSPSVTVDSLPLSISQLTGVPIKQMANTQAARYTGGAALCSPMASVIRRPAYAIMNSPTNGTNGAPGTPIGSPMPPSTVQVSANAPPPKNPKLYKTELCRSWMDQGRCNYGERCQYAHGEHEKRSVPRHPKYKTEMCQSFHKSGYCPYGARCHFIHSESELIANAAQSAAANAAIQAASLNSQLAALPMANQSQLRGTSLAPGAPLLGRLSSLPSYGSAGESPAGSSEESGSESPNGSFSPGLDMDDSSIVSPLSSVFSTNKRVLSYQQSAPERYGPGSGGFTDAYPSSNATEALIKTMVSWAFDDQKEDLPGRLPVFAQLSNPPQ